MNTIVQWGFWTRVNQTSADERSVLDYILMSSKIATSAQCMGIDEEGGLSIAGENETDHKTMTTTQL